MMNTDRAARSRARRQARREAEAEAPNPLREQGETGDGTPPVTEHENELLRQSVVKGQTLLQMLDDDLEAAWAAHENGVAEGLSIEKVKVIRGRVRGLAQAIATVRSPFSRQNLGGSSKAWAAVIEKTEHEALLTMRAKKKAESRGN